MHHLTRHLCPYFANCVGLMFLREWTEFNKATLCYKIVNGMCPDYLSEMFSFKSVLSYGLRSSSQEKINIPKHKNELFKRTFQYSGAVFKMAAAVGGVLTALLIF